MDQSEQGTADDREQHLRWAKHLFNDTWRLMDKTDRTADEDALMIHQAHASAYHWLQVGTSHNGVRSHWQCSRMYCVLGRPEPALYHARQALDLCRRDGIDDWDLAFTYEALARAYAVAGDTGQSAHWAARARATDIVEKENRELLISDLATIHTG
ncbi:MAG: hypothetical protein WCA46_18515 [Actinocatenispora sp.]